MRVFDKLVNMSSHAKWEQNIDSLNSGRRQQQLGLRKIKLQNGSHNASQRHPLDNALWIYLGSWNIFTQMAWIILLETVRYFMLEHWAELFCMNIGVSHEMHKNYFVWILSQMKVIRIKNVFMSGSFRNCDWYFVNTLFCLTAVLFIYLSEWQEHFLHQIPDQIVRYSVYKTGYVFSANPPRSG